MVLSMARPWKHPDTGVFYLRRRVPADLVPAVGRTLVKRSLATKDPQEARTRHAEALARLEREWEALRSGPVDLTHKEVRALVGRWYGWFIARHEDEPGDDPEGWGMVVDQLRQLDSWTLDHRDPEADGPRPAGVRSRIHAFLVKHGAVDEFLRDAGVILSSASRAAFLDALELDFVSAHYRLSQHSEGVYAPDERPASFPAWEPSAPREKAPTAPVKASGKVAITGLLDEWWREAQAAGRKPKTLQSYQSAINRLVAFLGHDDASRVTPEDVVAYKNHRIGQTDPRTGKPISAKTIKDSDLAGLKSVFGWAVVNRRLPENPVAGITMKVGKRRRARAPGFSDAEAAAILRAALMVERGSQTAKTHAAKRWVPWLCAYTGARVGEMAQLRREDVSQLYGIWVVKITPEAGTVKNDQFRVVPLHPHLVAQGFPAFVEASSSGHLFLQPARDGDVLGPLKGLVNRLREFVRREAGVDDPDVQPNHGWRHRMKTVTREMGEDQDVVNAIQGHATQTVSADYGEFTIRAMAALLDRFPRIAVEGDPTTGSQSRPSGGP